MDDWATINKDVFGEILIHTDWLTAARCRVVCKQWRYKIDKPGLSQKLCRAFFGSVPSFLDSSATFNTIDAEFVQLTLSQEKEKVVKTRLTASTVDSASLFSDGSNQVWIALSRERRPIGYTSDVSLELWDVGSSKRLKQIELGPRHSSLIAMRGFGGRLVIENLGFGDTQIFTVETEKIVTFKHIIFSNMVEGCLAKFDSKASVVKIYDLALEDFEKSPTDLSLKLSENFSRLMPSRPSVALTSSLVVLQTRFKAAIFSRKNGTHLRTISADAITVCPFALFAGDAAENNLYQYSLETGKKLEKPFANAVSDGYDDPSVRVIPGPGKFSFLYRWERELSCLTLLDSKGTVLGELDCKHCGACAYDTIRLACDTGKTISVFNLTTGKPVKTGSYELPEEFRCIALAFTHTDLLVLFKSGLLRRIPLVSPNRQ